MGLKEALVSALVIVTASVCLPGPAGAQSIGDVFRKVNPAVVVIRAKGQDVEGSGGLTPFTEIGSGVLVSADGKIMTAAHVVHSMNEINVEFLGGVTVPARVVSSEPAADLSLLQLTSVPKGVKPALLADSDTVRVGDQILIVGAPYGLSHSMSAGWISAKWPANSVYRSMPLAEFLQTDATINTGNSGGPMFNMAGDVIGIVSHNISKSGGSEGLGFVVTLNTARQLLLEKKSFWSGLEGQLLPDDVADLLNLPANATGYIVKNVARGSPGEEMGLRAGTKVVVIDGREFVLGGDIILEALGFGMKSANLPKIREALARLQPGDPFKVKVLRAGQTLELTGKVP